jgi:hypothetical protein
MNRFEFAAQRSHDAAKAANENSRPMAQYALVINGAAASAIIAFLSKEKISADVLSAAPCSLVAYTVGVISGALAMYFMTEALDFVSNAWRDRALGGGDVESEDISAVMFWWLVRIAVGVSVLSFIIGSGIFAHALITSAVVTPTPCVYAPG